MTIRKLAYCCLTGLLMWLCLVGGYRLANAHVENEHQPERPQTPAGDQFDEGPALVRLPGTSTDNTRFIF